MARKVPWVRTTERRDFKRCQQRWWWGWREGLRLRGEMPNALWFGIGMHEALATWYGPGLERRPEIAWEVWRDYVADEVRVIKSERVTGADELESERIEAGHLGEVMLEEYWKKYGQDEHVFVIQPEKSFQIDVPFLSFRRGAISPPVRGRRSPEKERVGGGVAAVYMGTYDMIFRDLRDDACKLMEHKTYNSIRTGHLPLDDQVGSYLWVAPEELRAAGLIGPREKIQSITYNILRKGLPDDRLRDAEGYALNKDGSRSKNQPAPLFWREDVYRTQAERVTQAARVIAEVAQMQAIRRGELPVTKNPTADCAWDCTFFQMCELHERGQDWTEFRDAIFKVEDPYADHRKSMSQ